MNANRNRALLMAVVGGYVLYLAYDLLKNLIDGNRGTMSVPVFILSITFFTVAGVALLIYAWKVWKGPRDEDPVTIGDEEEEKKEEAGESDKAPEAQPEKTEKAPEARTEETEKAPEARPEEGKEGQDKT